MTKLSLNSSNQIESLFVYFTAPAAHAEPSIEYAYEWLFYDSIAADSSNALLTPSEGTNIIQGSDLSSCWPEESAGYAAFLLPDNAVDRNSWGLYNFWLNDCSDVQFQNPYCTPVKGYPVVKITATGQFGRTTAGFIELGGALCGCR
jgi:hypothetical protein